MAEDEKRVKHVVVEASDHNTKHHLDALAEKHGVSKDVLLQHNEATLRAEAQARGFEPTYFRDVEGKRVVDYHVFPGTVLVIPDEGGGRGSRALKEDEGEEA